MSGVLLGLIHEVTAIIFTIPTFRRRASHFVVCLDEFLFLQIYSPGVNGRQGLNAFSSYAGAYDHVGGCFGVKAAKLKVLGNMRYLDNVTDNAAIVTGAVGLNDHEDFDCG